MTLVVTARVVVAEMRNMMICWYFTAWEMLAPPRMAPVIIPGMDTRPMTLRSVCRARGWTSFGLLLGGGLGGGLVLVRVVCRFPIDSRQNSKTIQYGLNAIYPQSPMMRVLVVHDLIEDVICPEGNPRNSIPKEHPHDRDQFGGFPDWDL
jgi:hypothetical protein